jgi:hypothetical protein
MTDTAPVQTVAATARRTAEILRERGILHDGRSFQLKSEGTKVCTLWAIALADRAEIDQPHSLYDELFDKIAHSGWGIALWNDKTDDATILAVLDEIGAEES